MQLAQTYSMYGQQCANCCYQLMHIASLSSRGTCVHLPFPIADKPVAQKGFCAVSIYIQYVWLAICYVYQPLCSYRTEANCCYQLMRKASLSIHDTQVHLSFPIAGKSVAQKGFCAVSIYIQYVWLAMCYVYQPLCIGLRLTAATN